MTKEKAAQIIKLKAVMIMVQDSIRALRQDELKVIPIWLSVAGDYCHEIAEELKKI